VFLANLRSYRNAATSAQRRRGTLHFVIGERLALKY
jgi:hypothetical protein